MMMMLIVDNFNLLLLLLMLAKYRLYDSEKGYCDYLMTAYFFID
jgi:hypothetical protein